MDNVNRKEKKENGYLLRASIEDSREVFHAGNKPAAKLRSTERTHTLERSWGRNTGVMLACAPPPPPGVRGARPELNKYAPLIPASNPSVDPIIPINKASGRHRERINLFFAPIDFIVPISRVLSLTEV